MGGINRTICNSLMPFFMSGSASEAAVSSLYRTKNRNKGHSLAGRSGESLLGSSAQTLDSCTAFV